MATAFKIRKPFWRSERHNSYKKKLFLRKKESTSLPPSLSIP